jgi:hypothetical protein
MQLHSLLLSTLFSVSLANPIPKPRESTYSISLYSKPDYQGEQLTFTIDGTHKVGFSGGAQSWIWESEGGDGCCIAFCRGSTVCSPTLTIRSALVPGPLLDHGWC